MPETARALSKMLPLLVAALVAGTSCKRGPEADQTKAANPPAVSVPEPGAVRPAAVAGAFYPADKDELSSLVKELLSKAQPKKLAKPLVALIVPHAGYPFSGEVAACGFKALQGRDIRTVVLIGNSHRASFDAAAVGDYDAFETPLGKVPVDRDLVKALLDSGPPFESIPPAHEAEHSLEVELPFLQTVLTDFKIVPILLGDETHLLTKAVGEGLAKALQARKDFVIVCSTDLSHYPAYEDAKRVDGDTTEALLALDEFRLRQVNDKRLAEGVRELHCTLCGLGATCATLQASKRLGADSAVLLQYANSGDVEEVGDRSRVVGYCAIALCGEAAKMRTEVGLLENESGADGLNDKQKGLLLRIARESVTAAVQGQAEPAWDVQDPALQEKCGAFVTLKKGGDLRGCIGYIEAVKPLWRTVADVAASAALNDFRFPPVSPAELEYLQLEISVLTPLRKMKDPGDIVIGKHGLLIREGGYQGLLLPQVATEWGWDKWEFLEHTCRKAGLPPGAWKDPDAEILLFSAQVFGEE